MVGVFVVLFSEIKNSDLLILFSYLFYINYNYLRGYMGLTDFGDGTLKPNCILIAIESTNMPLLRKCNSIAIMSNSHV